MGPEVKILETELANYADVQSVITCANGTDALTLALTALGLSPGDHVIVPAFTYVATAEAPAQLGAIPYFADVSDQTYNICPESVARCIAQIQSNGDRVAAIIGVDLFGLPCDAARLQALANEHDIALIIDAAQSFGGSIDGTKVGNHGDITTTSFFPAKPLGCYGDGGAIFTKSKAVGDKIRCLRAHGAGSHKYEHLEIGINSRLDTIQAAVLLSKLTVFDHEILSRRQTAKTYNDNLKDFVSTPLIPKHYESVFAQYTIKVEDRDRLKRHLDGLGVPSVVYYPLPLHLQPAYKHFPADPGGLTNSEQLANTVLSLPIDPYLEPTEVELIIQAVNDF